MRHPHLDKNERRQRNFHNAALHCPDQRTGQTHNPCNTHTHGHEELCIRHPQINPLFISVEHNAHTHASIQSKCNTHPLHITLFSDFRKWTHTVHAVTHPHTQTNAHITHSWNGSGATTAWQAAKGPVGSLSAPHCLFPFSSASWAFVQPVVSNPESGSASTSRLIVKKKAFLGVE